MRNYAAFCLLLFSAVQGNQFQKIQDQATGEWIPKEEYIISLNEDALLNYRDGWAVGDTDVILAKSPDSFTFTWLPANNTVVTKAEFPAFFRQFVKDAEAVTKTKYKMRFANIIHRTINDVTFEAAEWIVDGYDRGVYFNSAQGGKLVWDMATTEPGLQNKNY